MGQNLARKWLFFWGWFIKLIALLPDSVFYEGASIVGICENPGTLDEIAD
jgi:hypothetical protein